MMKNVPRNPQQNSVAKRMNRTLNKRVRSMRIHVGFPKTFEVDAINTIAYLIDRAPLVHLNYSIPKEV